MAVSQEVNTSSKLYQQEVERLNTNEKLANKMIYSGDKQEAQRVVLQMRQDFVGLTSDMEKQAKEEPGEVREISGWMQHIYEKAPVI